MTHPGAVAAASPPARRSLATLARLRFDRDGQDWPNRAASRFVRADILWHVQVMGTGPAALLIHGTGASTHSYAALAPLLARHFTVVLCDLPGHGFSEPLPSGRTNLPGMAAALAALLRALEVEPVLAVGHSAGAAIALRLCLDGAIHPGLVVSLNGALAGFGGPLARAVSPVARFLALNPLLPRFFARRARDPAVVDRLLERTGSRLDPAAAGFYRRLAADPDQVAAAFGMMAGWDLEPLLRDLPRLKVPVLLVAGARDGMVPARQAGETARRLARPEILELAGLGHLAHEEAPDRIAALIEAAAVRHGLLPEGAP